jgi:putative Ig domain-containing protein
MERRRGINRWRCQRVLREAGIPERGNAERRQTRRSRYLFRVEPLFAGLLWANDSSGSASLTCCIGGTSIAAPMWAGLAKLVAQKNNSRLGNMNPRIYQLGALGNASQSGIRDVTAGHNDYNGVTGFVAGIGYDQVTGWGTADMATFAAAYTNQPAPPPPPAPLKIGASSLPGGKVNTPYSASLSISGGKSPYKSTMVKGSLPKGLSLGASIGMISGTPTN